MGYKLTVALTIVCLLAENEALRILVMFPMMSRSHSILGNGIANHLLKAGHEVVLITAYPNKKPIANLTEVDVSSVTEVFKEEAEKSGKFDIRNHDNNDMGDSWTLAYFSFMMHKNLLEEPKVLEILNDPKEKFDAVIIEWFFSEMVSGIGPLLQCPLIWVVSTEPHWQALRLIDGISNPAYTVDLFAHIKPPLSFWGRTVELYKIIRKTIILSFISLFEAYSYNSIYSEIAAKRGVKIPSYSEAVYNASLMFINSHPSIGSPFRLPRNAINIGGYHITDDVQPLSKELQNIMDQAKHGVIYFSMGSVSKSSGMSDNMKQSLLGLFGKLKQTVIWKYETDMNNVPSNVLLLKWAPQQSILAHPNLKLFITHGGQLSTTESLYYGTPLIGIPIGADQYVNMKSVELKGFGIIVKLAEDMADDLNAAIKEILSNNTYKTRAKQLSFIFHDRPVAPGKEVVHWVEHVVKTRGAPHLRSPALHVPLYQKLYLDLLAVIVLIVNILYYVIRKMMRLKVNANKKSKAKVN